MIYAKTFNLIHFPKTGGTWLRRACEKLPKEYFRKPQHPRHLPYSALDPEDLQFPTYVFVRNPWDWYVSLYGHRHRNVVKRQDEFRKPYGQLDEFHKRVYDRFCGSFEHSLRTLSGWEPWEEKLGRPLRWMSDRFNYMVPENSSVHILLYEQCSPFEGLLRMFQETGAPLRPADLQVLNKVPAQNVGDRKKDYRSYYDDSLRQLVTEKDSKLISRFGYEF